MNELLEINSENIKDMIYTIRRKQVMLDRDLAGLYGVKNIRLREQVKRNIDRFPDDFMFRLADDEVDYMVSQNAIPSRQHLGGSLPYVFTEQGIAMLSSILKSEVATRASITIMRTFVEMRKFLMDNYEIFSRLERVELNQLNTKNRLDEVDQKFEQVFNYIAETREVSQKVFFNGQIYDAFSLLVDIVRKANKAIVLIDNYVGVDTLNILAKKKAGVKVDIYTTKKSDLTKEDTEKFNIQYKHLTVKALDTFHDRFIILDSCICYHIGASLKDAGKKSFAISKIEDQSIVGEVLAKLIYSSA